jgi:hypothetical protein
VDPNSGYHAHDVRGIVPYIVLGCALLLKAARSHSPVVVLFWGLVSRDQGAGGGGSLGVKECVYSLNFVGPCYISDEE